MKKIFTKFSVLVAFLMLNSANIFAYDLWIGSTQVTDANKANIRSGVTYNSTTNVLTLNNAEFQCENEHCIESDIEGLKIELVGENVLTSGKNVLLLRKKCTITGNGKLFATSTEKVYLCAAIAVESCQVTIENTTISAEGYAGILGRGLSGNSIIFKNSSIEATGSYCPICFFGQGVTFVDCEITSPANAVYDGERISLNNQRYKRKVVISPTAASSGTHNNHEYVDLGLPSGTLWATCNVGATTPEGFGDHFAWGEITTKTNYSWDNYKFGKYDETASPDYGMTKYNMTDNKTVLVPEDDAASVTWGGDWRMPTGEEQEELIKKCTWTWATKNGVNGYEVKSKTNGNSIFLPAAGQHNFSQFDNAGSNGDYWSSQKNAKKPCDAFYFRFGSGYIGQIYSSGDYRRFGKSVRPVYKVATKYDLNLGDVQATSKNASDILGDGTASYNPTTKTLTLNGANIATAKGGISLNLGKDCDSVKLVGNNTCGFIWQSNDCVITGSGSLHCTNEIRVAADMLTILNTTVVTDDKISGDEGDEALKIINSNVTVKKDGIGYLNITLEKCAIVQPIGAVNTGRFIELDGKTVSDEIVIEANIFGVKETLSENVKIRMQNRQLTVENSKRDAITIYNVMGQVVAAKQNPNETETFTIPAAGAYIVKVGKGATRVVTL